MAEAVSLRRALGLNRSTAALLVAIGFIGIGQELWAPFMPAFIEKSLRAVLASHGRGLGWSETTIVLLAVGCFGSWKDFQEAVYYYLGGRIGGTLGTRRALIGFALMPLVGYALLLCAFTPLLATIMAFVSLPFVSAYDSISQPATLRVVGDTLEARHRTLAFSLQSIQRRIARIAANLIGGVLVYAFGEVLGVKAGVALSVVFVLIALFVQLRLLHTDAKDTAKREVGFSLRLIRRFDPQLKRLLLADVLARIAEGMPRELLVLYALVQTTAVNGIGALGVDARTYGVLLALQSLTSLVLYVPIGWLAARPGARKQPFIGLTFLFFAIFPLAFWALGSTLGVVGLALAFVVGGLREIGEPARKALITELVPADAKTAATGLYWSVRTAAVMLAPLAGALVWILAGPPATFVTACVVGLAGAAFFAWFARRPAIH